MNLKRSSMVTVFTLIALLFQFALAFPNPGAAAAVGSNTSSTDSVGYDFAANLCAAAWSSKAGILPCPGTNGDARGFAVRVETPRLEDNTIDPLPGILVAPQNKYDGYIRGTYPEFTVQRGDRFQTLVGCDYGKACYVTFRLEYQIGNSAPVILGDWSAKNEKLTYAVNKDLSSLTGQTVKFTLTLLAAGPVTNDIAIWAHPQIKRIVPTATSLPPASLPNTYYDFASNACVASWASGAGTLPCPGKDGDSKGYVLPVNYPKLENGTIDNAQGLILSPQNKYDGYIKGVYPEITIQSGDRFQGVVNCVYDASCYVTFQLDYQVGSGPVTNLWSWMEKNEGQFHLIDKDLSALAGKNVKFILTILSTGPATNDRALWSQPRIFRPGYVSSTPTATGTATVTVTSEPNTATPTATVTSEPDTATPTPTATSEPDTATPTPTVTSEPNTATPTPTVTSEPDTATPTPTVTATSS